MTRGPSPSSGTVEIDRIWKRFRMDRNRPVLRDEVGRLTDHLKGRTDSRRWRWALRNVDLSIKPGEAIGLFGANGSGKSTLLKILTRVMYPTVGDLRIAGRIGALIEIRAGVHPDLTGRENIYLYGSIMGLKRSEIETRFESIVDFAELSEALDRQLKYYSSGMAMRLGFAVAAFLQPDVLLVDEVLAVGDAKFQQKCLDRMRAVLQEGTTLIFVSHDLASIEAIAQRGIWLRDGAVAADGPIRESIGAYRHYIETSSELVSESNGLSVAAKVTGAEGSSPRCHEPLHIEFTVESIVARHAVAFIGASEGPAAPVFALRHDLNLAQGINISACTIPSLPLPRGRYSLWMALTDVEGGDLISWRPVGGFDVEGEDLDPFLPGVMRLSPVAVEAHWDSRSALASGPFRTEPA